MKKVYWICLAALMPAVVMADGAWAENLHLSRGGFWKCRVPIAVVNGADTAVSGAVVEVRASFKGALPIAGTRAEELRLVNERGTELVFGLWDGDKRIKRGKVPENAVLSVPVVLSPRGGAVYHLYWNNPAAWGREDFYDKRAAADSRLDAVVGGVETLNYREVGHDVPWAPPAGTGEWDFRVPLRVANFSDKAMSAVLTSFSLREAVRGTRYAQWRLVDEGRAIDGCGMGDYVFFTCDVPENTLKTCWLYVRAGDPGEESGPEEARSALGSIIPSDQRLVCKTKVDDEKAYAALVNSSANLLKNPSFENGAEGWTTNHEDKRSTVKFETPGAGGRLGGGFAKMTIPAAAEGRWRGWYQSVKIVPGKNYFYGGFLAAEGGDERTTISAHRFNRAGKNTLMASTRESVIGTTGWVPTFGTMAAGAEDVTFTLHLTTHGHGTISHDGLLVAEYARAVVGEPMMPPAVQGEKSELSVMAVDPVVKVFRETGVRNGGDFAVSLARNETEPLQLAVRSSKPVDKLEVEVEVPGADVRVEIGWVEYVPVDYPSSYYSLRIPDWELRRPVASHSCDGWSGWWPDPIAPVNSGSLQANVTQPVWLNVISAKTAKSGPHEGRIRWKADGKMVREDRFVVNVWNFELPEIPELPAIYDLRLYGKHWNYDCEGLNGDEKRRLFMKFFAEKRICPDRISGSPKFSRGKDGAVVADFADYDRQAAEYFDEFKFAVSYMPGCFYGFGWGMPPKPFLGENPYEGKWPYEGVDRGQLRSEYRRAYQEALWLYWNHMKEKGWANRLVLYISDEPHFQVPEVKAQMIAMCRMIHEVDKSIRIYSSTWRHCPEWDNSLDVWGVAHYGAFPERKMQELAAKGSHIWFTTDGQMCLDTPYCAIERMLPHYSAAHHAEAYEFWGATWLTYDPWKYGWHSYIPQSDTPGKRYHVRYPDGDGYLMYPGVKGRFKGPVTSIRLEAARDGVEDFSYLKALERLAEGATDKAERAAALLKELRALVPIPSAGGRYSSRILPVPERLSALRLKVGALLAE